MSNGADIWMPLYVGDYLADTVRLTLEEHGAYMLLRLDYWKNGAPPDDDEVLSRIVRAPADVWARVRPAVARLFKIEGRQWRDYRLEEERQKADTRAADAKARARRAAQVRWNGRRASEDQPKGYDAPSIAPGKH